MWFQKDDWKLASVTSTIMQPSLGYWVYVIAYTPGTVNLLNHNKLDTNADFNVDISGSFRILDSNLWPAFVDNNDVSFSEYASSTTTYTFGASDKLYNQKYKREVAVASHTNIL